MTIQMHDFKSYSLDNKKSGKTIFIRFLLIILLLAIAAGIFLLMADQQAQEEQAIAPSIHEEPSKNQETDRVTLPLTLPGQPMEEGRLHEEPTSPAAKPDTDSLVSGNQDETPEITVQQEESIGEAPQETRRLTHQIAQGDTLSSIFKRLGLSASLLHKIIHSSKAAGALKNIKPGEMLHVELDNESNLVNLTLQHSKVDSLFIQATQDGKFHTTDITRDVELRTAHIQATIENSLYLSAQEAGLPDSVIMELADIFGWDIDFALEIRNGDRFTVIYQEQYLEGEKLRNGPILAAEFVNQGRTYRAVRYQDETGNADYYTPDGHSMRKAFLRAPVDFRRISSRFTKERWHPVLGKKRPHRGVDYAASTGTPIKAAGDGKIIHRGKKGGYGRTVIIQHGQNYTTLYGHLSRYNKKAKNGSKVKQGQTIGYVGSSGLATGPHLHYEFRVNGVHRNPLTVKLPDAEPIAKKYRTDFLSKTGLLTAQLDTLNRIVVADAR